MLNSCSFCVHPLLRRRIVPDAAERIGRRVVSGTERFDDPLNIRRRASRPSGPRCPLGKRADCHDAFRAIVKLVRLPTVGSQLLGQEMRVLGRLDEWIVALLSCSSSKSTSTCPTRSHWSGGSTCRGTWPPSQCTALGNRASCAVRRDSSWRQIRRRPWARNTRAAEADCESETPGPSDLDRASCQAAPAAGPATRGLAPCFAKCARRRSRRAFGMHRLDLVRTHPAHRDHRRDG